MRYSTLSFLMGGIIALNIIILYDHYRQSKYLSRVTKTEIFALTKAIKGNSCFHLMLPGEDYEPSRKKKNSKTKSSRNKSSYK